MQVLFIKSGQTLHASFLQINGSNLLCKPFARRRVRLICRPIIKTRVKFTYRLIVKTEVKLIYRPIAKRRARPYI